MTTKRFEVPERMPIDPGLPLRRSEWYWRSDGLYMCKEYAEAESWLRYALLGGTPLTSPADQDVGRLAVRMMG